MINNGYQQYQRSNVTSAPPETLVVLLYSELLCCLISAREACRRNDAITKNKNTIKAIRILTELMISLNMEEGQEVALNLSLLYEYISKKLLQAGRDMATAPYDEAIKLLSPLKEAWESVASPRGTAHTALTAAVTA
jgi:flagellar protein FliS